MSKTNWDPANADPAVGSFLPGLRWVVERSEGPILELGAGYFSTPYLHEVSREGRDVWTYEFDVWWWAEVHERFKGPHHKFGGTLAQLPIQHWSVVLIDCEGWERQNFFNALARRSDTIVVHDSQDPWITEDSYTPFPYRYDYDTSPRTTLVSRTLNVRECGL